MRGCLFILCCGLFAVPQRRITGNPRFFMETTSQNKDFLSLPIPSLPATEVFKLRSKLMGLSTLSDVFTVGVVLLSRHEDYSERWYLELVNLLERYDRLDLLT